MTSSITHVEIVHEDGTRDVVCGAVLVIAPLAPCDTRDQIVLRQVMDCLINTTPDEAARVLTWAMDVTRQRQRDEQKGGTR